MISYANAKINIGLHVTGRREDGYHTLETIFYPVKLYDVLEFIPTESFSFHTLGNTIPPTDLNLCEKAYYLLKADYDVNPLSIYLLKNIPIGAGLGGGSADAAFVLKTINEQQNLGISNAQLKKYAEKLGADCPFFIDNKPVFAHGIGTSFENISLDLNAYFIVIVMPDVFISTAEAYRNIVPKTTDLDLREIIKLPIQEWREYITNDFEKYTIQKYPDLAELKRQLYASGALYASMSGSGSAFYGIFDRYTDLAHLSVFGKVYYPVEL